MWTRAVLWSGVGGGRHCGHACWPSVQGRAVKGLHRVDVGLQLASVCCWAVRMPHVGVSEPPAATFFVHPVLPYLEHTQ